MSYPHSQKTGQCQIVPLSLYKGSHGGGVLLYLAESDKDFVIEKSCICFGCVKWMVVEQ